jgi:hypothetical protein
LGRRWLKKGEQLGQQEGSERGREACCRCLGWPVSRYVLGMFNESLLTRDEFGSSVLRSSLVLLLQTPPRHSLVIELQHRPDQTSPVPSLSLE